MKKINYKTVLFYIALLFFLQLASFLSFKYYPIIINDNFIFGMLGSNFLAIAISAIIAPILIYLVTRRGLIAKYNKSVSYLSLTIILILIGLISNILDRLIYGGVVDYINFFGLNWFNLADVLIVLSTIIIFYYMDTIVYIATSCNCSVSTNHHII